MTDWLTINSEWVFSGIGVAVITGAMALFGRLRQKQAPEVVVRLEHTGEQIRSPGAPGTGTISVERIAPISPEGLQASIESAPLLQREATAQRYNGQRIEWDTELAGAEQKDDLVQLFLRAKKGPNPGYPYSIFVSCNVKLNDYRELALLSEGAPIRVNGVIEKATSTSIDLADARLSVHPTK